MSAAVRLFFFLLFIAIFSCESASAKQLSFSKKQQQGSYIFQYQWLDHENVRQEISFSLTNDGLFNHFRSFKAYKAHFANKAILQLMKKQLHKKPMAGVQITFLQNNGEIKIDVKGRNRAKVSKTYNAIVKLEQETTQKYLKDNFYHTFITHNQVQAIKPDHAHIANESVSDLKVLKPLILEKVSIQNIRKVTNFVLSFVQSIPYSTLESRITSSGAGFNPPLKVLWENQGDCDSKMTLTASLLRALMPRIEMVLIYIDQHAFIGLAIPAQSNDISIEHNNTQFVLAEPTGPALLPLGKLAPESELAINQGRYSVESFYPHKQVTENENQ